MSSSSYYNRRFKPLASSPPVQLFAICICVILCIRWVIRHNHDDDLGAKYKVFAKSVDTAKVDWFKLYYVTYVTTEEDLCNAVMMWSEIQRIGSRAQRMMFYPADWDEDKIGVETNQTDGLTPRTRLLRIAKKAYFVKRAPLEILSAEHPERPLWTEPYTKLLAFNLTKFDRVLVISPDSTILKNLDELFLFPSAPIAMPYMYHSGTEPPTWSYSTKLLLVEPSEERASAVKKARESIGADGKDIDILTSLTPRKIVRIPQRPYQLTTSEFRQNSHVSYLTERNRSDVWDPERIMDEAKILQFDDNMPKPWFRARRATMNSNMPICREREGFGASDCRDRATWLGFYGSFQLKMETLCGTGFEVVDDDKDFEEWSWDARTDYMI